MEILGYLPFGFGNQRRVLEARCLYSAACAAISTASRADSVAAHARVLVSEATASSPAEVHFVEVTRRQRRAAPWRHGAPIVLAVDGRWPLTKGMALDSNS